jgi:drug/metabolite transporter (DMT)-like permease
MLALGIRPPSDRSWMDWCMVAGSGTLGLAFADSMLFAGLSRIGAARLAVVDTIYAPIVMFLSSLFLQEHLTGWFLVGAIGVLGGVAIASIEKGAMGGLDPELRRGLLYAATAIASTATGVVLVKPVLERSDLLEVTWSRMIVGFTVQTAYLVLTGGFQQTLRDVTRTEVWKAMLPAAVLGTWVSLLLWLGGFKWAPASVAAVLNQLGTVYILVMAHVFLKEKVTVRQTTGALIAAASALVILLMRG